jgi:hypothetical protein
MGLEMLGLLQWPAMAASLAAAWLVASTRKRRRNAGFWVFLLSNVLWIAWGWHDDAYALIALQLGLALTNIRGVFKTTHPTTDAGAET